MEHLGYDDLRQKRLGDGSNAWLVDLYTKHDLGNGKAVIACTPLVVAVDIEDPDDIFVSAGVDDDGDDETIVLGGVELHHLDHVITALTTEERAGMRKAVQEKRKHARRESRNKGRAMKMLKHRKPKKKQYMGFRIFLSKDLGKLPMKGRPYTARIIYQVGGKLKIADRPVKNKTDPVMQHIKTGSKTSKTIKLRLLDKNKYQGFMDKIGQKLHASFEPFDSDEAVRPFAPPARGRTPRKIPAVA